MSSMRTFDLLVFDWDGTLVDSEAQIVAAMQGAIDAAGAEPRDAAAVRDIIGLGLYEAIATLFPDSEAALHETVRAHYREQFYRRMADEPPALFDGVRETLESLRANGYRLAVATGKARDGLQRALAATGLDALFDATRCADECRSKPDPLMLHELLAETGVASGAALMVGDTEYDLLMASAARVPALGVSYGVHERERLLRHAPLGCIDRFEELGEWLERGEPACGVENEGRGR